MTLQNNQEKKYLLECYGSILHNFGGIAGFTGLILLSPLTAIPFYPDEFRYVNIFIIPALISFVISIMFLITTKKNNKPSLNQAHSAVLVVLTWLYASVMGALPFMLTGKYRLVHGMFEAVSGWTTTGLSVVDVANSPHIILLWRSIMQFVGGAGFVMIFLSIFNAPSASGVFRAEGHTDEIMPHVKLSAQKVLKVYTVFLIVGITFYVLSGMSHFDAINHAMAALSTGGFSTYTDSIGHFNSPVIELITIILMLLGQSNFALYISIFEGKWKDLISNVQTKTTAVILFFFIIITCIFVTAPIYMDNNACNGFFTTLRRTVFECTSALTTTGFSTISYHSWGILGLFLLSILMLLGGHTNSTAGGIKMLRIYILFRCLVIMFRNQFLPRSAIASDFITIGDKRMYLKLSDLYELLGFIMIYMITLLAGTAILTGLGYSLSDSFFEYSSVISNSGLSVGITVYNSPDLMLWVETAGMFLGRLEFVLIIYGFIRIFKDIFIMTK